jgi:RimJ/RimL family protein N-acetyltransferase
MIYGNGLRLRAIEKEDIPRFVRWLNDPEVRENLLLFAPMSLDEEEEWYNSVLKRPKEERPLAIEIEIGGEWLTIGNISLMRIDWHARHSEVGLFIGEKQYWNRGYGSEALRVMVGYAFDFLNLNKVYLNVYETNPRGIRAYQKVGFVEEGRLRQEVYKNGRYIDVLVMSILRSEWYSSRD